MRLLTGAMLVYNCGSRLHSLVADLRTYCDEVILGVDLDSDPLTMDLATRVADVVLFFPHREDFDAHRLDLIRQATCAWVLLLDDDERLGGEPDSFRAFLRLDEQLSGFWLSRQWVASLDPLTYFCEEPWYPDWQLRVLRNVPAQISYPGGLHASLQVQGSCAHLATWPIWHYERVVRTRVERDDKFRRYAAAGGFLPHMAQYYQGSGPTRPLPEDAHPDYRLLTRGSYGATRLVTR